MTIEDIIEEIIGEFTTQAPGGSETIDASADGSVVVDGMAPLRTLNRKLGTHFPLDGPKTLNGLIVEQLGEIPDAGTQFRRRRARRSKSCRRRIARSRSCACCRRSGAPVRAFTKPGRAGIITELSFMRLE